MSSLIVQEVSQFIKVLFEKELPEHLAFHRIGHTEEVVENALFIGEQCGLDDEHLQLLEVAAWFHDSGYCYIYKDHETTSIAMAAGFLSNRGCQTSYIKNIENLIAATRLPQNPFSIIEEVMCDADLAHLTSESYPVYTDNLRQEWAFYLNKTYTDEAWDRQNIDFLTNHHYFSEYGQTVLEPLKEIQLNKLKSKRGI